MGDDDLALDGWKSRALSAEAKVIELEQFKNTAIHEIAVLKSKLNTAEVTSIGYMAELDKKDQVLKSIHDEISSKVGQAIASKLDSLTTVNQNVNRLLNFFSSSDDSPGVFDQSLEGLAQRLESELNPIEDSIKQTNDVLTSFGLSTGVNTIDIPEMLTSISSKANEPKDSPVHDRVGEDRTCFYETNNTDLILVCKCRCGLEVKACKNDICEDPQQHNINVSQVDLSKPPPKLVTPSSLKTPSTGYSTPQLKNHDQSQVGVPNRSNKNKPYLRDTSSSGKRPSESSMSAKIVKPKMLLFNSATPNMQLFKRK